MKSALSAERYAPESDQPELQILVSRDDATTQRETKTKDLLISLSWRRRVVA